MQACDVLLSWDWENTLQQRTPSSLSINSHPPPANMLHQALRHSCVPALNTSHITEPKSHEITNVNCHISYSSRKMTLTVFCWVFLIRHAFCWCAILKIKTKHTVLTFNVRNVSNLKSDCFFQIPCTSKLIYFKIIQLFINKPSSFYMSCAVKVKSGHICVTKSVTKNKLPDMLYMKLTNSET